MSTSLRYQLLKVAKPHWPLRKPLKANKSPFHEEDWGV